MPTKVEVYGCSQPTREMQELLGRQLHLAHRYYNGLIELENGHRAAVEELRKVHSPAYREATEATRLADAAVLAAIEACQAAKARDRTATAPDAERQAVTDARAAVTECRRTEGAARRAVHADAGFRTARTAATTALIAARKARYAAYPNLFWGTKNAVAEAVEAAANPSREQLARLEPYQQFRRLYGPLRFKRWDRNGRLYCQVMGGITAAEAHGCEDGRLQIQRTPGKRKRVTIRVRVGSTGPGNRVPVWAEFSANMDRPLPADGTIKGVSIVRTQGWYQFSGGRPVPRDEWQVQVTVVTPERTTDAVPPKGVVGIDVGWRRIGDDLRVAVWVDDEGNKGELVLPKGLCDLWPAADETQGQRDLLFNAMRNRLADFLETRWPTPDGRAVPAGDIAWDDLRQAAATIRQWRGLERLHGLIARSPELRGDGVTPHTDAEVVRTIRELREWQYQDSGLEMRLRCDTRKALFTRREIYRAFAAEMTKKYKRVVVECLDVHEMRRNAAPEEEPDAVRKRWRDTAAIGLLLNILKSARHVEPGRGVVTREDAAHTTSDCRACGSRQDFDRGRLRHTCTACGVAWDQDENAARNLLARSLAREDGGERPGDGENPDPARPRQVANGPGDMPKAEEKKRVRRTRKSTRSQPPSENTACPPVA